MRTTLFGFPHPVDEVSARLVATGVVATCGLYLATRWPWVLVVLAWGFVSRVATGPTLSPLGQLVTRVIRPRLAWSERLAPGPPKRFAQGIGAAFSTSALIALAIDADGVALVLVGVLAGFAFLEAAAGFCAGCWVFRALMRTGLVAESTCETCNDFWSPTGV